MRAINPWSSREIKYGKVFEEFGLKKFPEKWKSRLNHYLIERMVIAHRDFNKIMACIEEKRPFINISGDNPAIVVRTVANTGSITSFVPFIAASLGRKPFSR